MLIAMQGLHQGNRMNARPLPFKGRDGVGMGRDGGLIDEIAAR